MAGAVVATQDTTWSRVVRLRLLQGALLCIKEDFVTEFDGGGGVGAVFGGGPGGIVFGEAAAGFDADVDAP